MSLRLIANRAFGIQAGAIIVSRDRTFDWKVLAGQIERHSALEMKYPSLQRVHSLGPGPTQVMHFSLHLLHVRLLLPGKVLL